MDCATFHGDYINVTYGSDGVANVALDGHARIPTRWRTVRAVIYFARK